MIEVAMLIHFAVIITGIVTLFYDYKQKSSASLSLFMGANTVFVFVFGLIPLILILNNFYIGRTDSYLIQTIDYENESYLSASLYILVGYTCMLCGYFLSKPYNIRKYEYKLSQKTANYYGYIILAISTVVTLLFMISLGGLLNSIQYIQLIRSNNLSISGPLFLLLPLSIVTFVIFLSKQLMLKKMYSINLLWLALSLFNSLYYVIIFGGRLPLVLFVLIIPMYIIDKRQKISIKNISIIFIVGLIVLNYGENLFDHLSGNIYQTRSILSNIPRNVTQFSFPYINTLKVHKFTYDTGEFRYFIDFISWIINYIPASISDAIGLGQITPSYAVNTYNHHMFDPTNPTAGGVPTDIITFGYYQFALPGVIIISLAFGKILAIFDKIFFHSKRDVLLSIIKIRVFQILSFYPMYADIEAFMRRRIDVVVLLMLVIFGVYKVNKKEIETSHIQSSSKGSVTE
ncbi:MAG: oligosaccharide repeat unit polymerase [Gudongella sp.]|nr:oligosaccharide repeat unit polymerase [Gudongella sp.]